MDIDYESRRRQNIADNKRILAEIGLINPFKNLPKISFKKSGLKRKADSELQRKPKRSITEQNVDHANRGSLIGTRRRSARLQGNDTPSEMDLQKQIDQWEEEGEDDTPKPVAKNRPHVYGAIEGVDVGASWFTRMECCRDGIHRPTVAGIHGGPDGAYSIALSGGYDDNVDLGDCFTYTGEGGRDLKGTRANPKNLRTAAQSKDQTLTRGNLALSRSVDTGNPVRVIRGYKLTSPFAPEEGYRFDGLYTVEKAWFTTGLSGFGVWKFALRRCKDQAPTPWQFANSLNDSSVKQGKEEPTSNNNDTLEKDLNVQVSTKEEGENAENYSADNDIVETAKDEEDVGKKENLEEKTAAVKGCKMTDEEKKVEDKIELAHDSGETMEKADNEVKVDLERNQVEENSEKKCEETNKTDEDSEVIEDKEDN